MAWQHAPEPIWIDNDEDIVSVVRRCRDAGMAAIDTETTGLDRRSCYTLFWSLCPDIKVRYCLSPRMLHHPAFKELASDPTYNWLLWNAKFDLHMLANTGLTLRGKPYCGLAGDWLRDENRRQHGLKYCAKDYLGLHMRSFEEVFGRKKKGEDVGSALIRVMKERPKDARDYASMDAWATFRIHTEKLQPDLENEEIGEDLTLWDYFDEIEAPFTRVLYNYERRGIRIDLSYMEEIRPKLEQEIHDIEKEINKIAGWSVNLRSPKQLQRFLFDELKYQPYKTTKGGASGKTSYSTDEECLTFWAEEQARPEAQLILRSRSLNKTLGTYVNGLTSWVDKNNRIHPILNQHRTVTGRLSSSDPNLQNIPRASDDDWKLRGAFIPAEGHVLLASDYDQVEMFLLAHFAEEENMISAIHAHRDLHANTASMMNGVPYEDIMAAKHRKENKQELSAYDNKMLSYRQDAKTIGFGLNYGTGPRKLAASLGIELSEAKQKIEDYFGPNPKVRTFIKWAHDYAKKFKEVRTLMQRARRLPDISSNQDLVRMRAQRQAVNVIIQGSVADLVKMAMLRIEASIDPLIQQQTELDLRARPELGELGARPLLQIHDELIVEAPEDTADEIIPIVEDLMEHPLKMELLVPLRVGSGKGRSWAEAKG